MTNLDRALDLILAHEGGWSNHPADTGGATRYGITHGTLADAHAVLEGLPANVRDLTKGQARMIYSHMYWRPSAADLLPWPACYAQIDAAVQHGTGRARRLLQAALNVEVDGVAGPKTRAAIEAADWTEVLPAMLVHRALYYMRILSNPTQAVFARGWANRLEDVARVSARGLPDAFAPLPDETQSQRIEAPTISLAEPILAPRRTIHIPPTVTRLTEVPDHIDAAVATSGRSKAEVFLAFVTKVVHIGHDAARTAADIVSIWERINADHRPRR